MSFAKRILAAGIFATTCASLQTASAQDVMVSGPPLFANQYTQGNANAATAEMYVAPVPVPEYVGRTYYTYQPLYPHEMLYWHHDRYHSYYDNGAGLNRTSVHYYRPPVRTVLSGIGQAIQLPRPF